MERYGQQIAITSGSGTCALVLHGYSETPYEYKHVAEAIASTGVDVLVPVLPHHGVDSTELLKANRAETWQWLEGEVYKLKQRYGKVILVGQSMGAGAAITAATSGVPIDGMVVAAVNGVPSTKVRLLMGIARAFHVTSFKARHRTPRRVGLDPAYLEWKRASFPTLSLHVFLEALDDLDVYIKETCRIRVPIMVIHGARDFATKVQKTSDFYFDNVGSTKKMTVIVEDTGHAAFFSPHFDATMALVRDFIDDVAKRGNDGSVAMRYRVGKHGTEAY